MTSTKKTSKKLAEFVMDNEEITTESIESTETTKTVGFKMVFDFLIFIQNNFTKIVNYVSLRLSNEQDGGKKSTKKSKNSMTNIKNMNHEQMIDIIKQNIGFVMLGAEVYCLFFHILSVRIWIFMNLLATLMIMYDTLNSKETKDRLIPIGSNEIKKYSTVVISCGVLMLLFFTQSVGMMTIPIILYLINRTVMNVFY